MISVEDWAEIRRLHRAEGLGIRAIARHMDVARNTVREALRSDGPPRYERAGPGSIVDEVEPAIRELLRDVPTMPATVIAERIGWTRGMTVLRDRIWSCGRCSCRRTRRSARSIGRASWPSSICGSPTCADPGRVRPDGQAVGGGRGVGLLPVLGRLDGSLEGSS